MITPKNTLIERLFICGECEYKTGGGFISTCKQCGCIIEAKARISNQSCPLNKWLSVGSTEAPKPIVKMQPCCGGK